MEDIARYKAEDLVYIDESGIDNYLCYPWGYGLRGQKVYGEVSGKKYARESIIAGKNGNKIIAPMCFYGTCNTAVFNTWIEQMLLPELKHGQVVVLDNASFHKSAKTKELIEQVGCKLLFLPPYSPDLNPIEKYWAHLKAKIKKIIHRFDKLSNAIDHAFIVPIST